MNKGIKDILSVEKQTEEIINNAQKKAEKIVSNAQAGSIGLQTDFEKELDKKKEDALKKTEKELAKECEKIIKKGNAEKDKLKKKAQKNMDSAVDYVISVLKKR